MSLARLTFFIVALAPILNRSSQAHEGHQAATYEVTPPGLNLEQDSHIRLRIIDDQTGRPVAARFTLLLNEKRFVPSQLGQHGLRFLTIHQRKNHRFVATYSRGTGDVVVPVPSDTLKGTIAATKGFEYLPVRQSFDTSQGNLVEIRLRRWSMIHEAGWRAADEHLHYERKHHRFDADWLTMLDGDGLSHAHFMVLKGGNLPGVWADQFAYGKQGQANDGKRRIIPGEEYRDSAQGHINLLGVDKVIQPISTGGLGEPKVTYNFPPLADVFAETHRLNGIGGPAHGGSLARSSTAILDTVLGRIDFFEIANSHLYKTDIWYKLLNCGFIVPPMAGTDLPNFGFRDDWQPLLGEVRTYVRCGESHDFESWKKAVQRGEVFVTSGPLISLQVNGQGPGSVVQLPSGGGEVTVTANISSPRHLESFELIQMGEPLDVSIKKQRDSVHRWTIQKRFKVTESCWLAARGTGGPKTAIEEGLKIRQSEIAHTGVIQVLVGEQRIGTSADLDDLQIHLAQQQEFYRDNGKYENAEDRLHFLDLFDQALNQLENVNAN